MDKADKLSVTFVNDMMADAALVKYDSNTGIAIISVDKSLLDDTTTCLLYTSNKKFQKEQLMKEGYEEFVEFFNR